MSSRPGTWCRPTANGLLASWWRVQRPKTLDSLDLQFPKVQGAALKELEQVRAALEAEGREHANAKKPSTSKDR